MVDDIARVMAEMEEYAIKKWKATEVKIEMFSQRAEMEMRDAAPGPDTGTLDKSIKAEFVPGGSFMGNFSAIVRTKIEDNANPNNGESAAKYGGWWNDGHYNIFLRKSVPPWYFMEGGAKSAYRDLQAKLNILWGY